MIAALKSLTNNRVTISIYSFGLHLYNNPSSQLENMMKYTKLFIQATLQPIGLVCSSIGFLYIAKKANTKKQKAMASIAAIATGIIASFSIYTLFNTPTNMENRFRTKEEECMRSAFEAYKNCVK
ncbi:MAG: hypothetical protein K1060chlam4_00619 [Candidatus Anoxychlamydiales bacterium]|nr:hypothetical protein [Candidatus Anoxychlamydiales bacterium]